MLLGQFLYTLVNTPAPPCPAPEAYPRFFAWPGIGPRRWCCGFAWSRESPHCLAGFILLTPDDEGRLYEDGEDLRQRARHHVLLEAGHLTETFAEAVDPKRIHLTLKQSEIANPKLYPELAPPASTLYPWDVRPQPEASAW